MASPSLAPQQVATATYTGMVFIGFDRRVKTEEISCRPCRVTLRMKQILADVLEAGWR
jgi:hypothetical protein